MDAAWARCALVVVAGGRGTRMARADPSVPDKLAAPLGATTVLGELLTRVPRGVPVVVVGPERAVAPRTPAVLVAREDPPGGGPAAAAAAGVAALRDAAHLTRHPDGSGGIDVVAVCAGDAPWSPLAVPVLLAALRGAPDAAAVVAVDGSGVRQPLQAVHRASVLLARLEDAGDITGRAAGWLLGPDPLEVALAPGAADDIDTPEQLTQARRRASGT